MPTKLIINISPDSNTYIQQKKLNIGDTITIKLERILGNAENWRLKNNSSNIKGMKFLGMEEPENINELEGGKSLVIYSFRIVDKTNALLSFEFGRVLGKSFEFEKKVDLKILVK